MNAFYASVECLYHPEIRDKPVAVAGDSSVLHDKRVIARAKRAAIFIKTGFRKRRRITWVERD